MKYKLFEKDGGATEGQIVDIQLCYKHFLKTGNLYHKKCMVVIRENKEFRNRCYHGTGSEESAREAVRGQQKGTSVPEQCTRGDGQ